MNKQTLYIITHVIYRFNDLIMNFLLKVAIYMQITFAEEEHLTEEFTFSWCYTSELKSLWLNLVCTRKLTVSRTDEKSNFLMKTLTRNRTLSCCHLDWNFEWFNLTFHCFYYQSANKKPTVAHGSIFQILVSLDETVNLIQFQPADAYLNVDCVKAS